MIATTIATLAGCAASDEPANRDDPACRTATAWNVDRDVHYASMPGVDPTLLALDVHRPVTAADCAPRPVFAWVHGGDWRGGDKEEIRLPLQRFVTDAGWLLVSINYRLSPLFTGDPGVIWPAHGRDVASAVRWIQDSIASYGGDASRIALVGFSAGAQIVATLGAGSPYLADAGVDLRRIRCVASLETSVYDIPAILAAFPDDTAEFANIFGSDPAVWRGASATLVARSSQPIAPYFIVLRGDSARRVRQQQLGEAIVARGKSVTFAEAGNVGHFDVFTQLGEASDTAITPRLRTFLQRECMR